METVRANTAARETAIAIPVSLVGVMIFAKGLNFSLNSLTMLGLVLATGLVVDDGILVVEAIVAKMQNEGLSARQARFEAMNELAGAVIAKSQNLPHCPLNRRKFNEVKTPMI